MKSKFLQALKDVWYLCKESFKLVTKTRAVIITPLLMTFFSILPVILITVLSIIYQFPKEKVFGLTLLIAIPYYLFILYFINTFLSAAHCWVVAKAHRDEKVSYIQGLFKALKEIFDIVIYSIFCIIIAAIVQSLKAKTKGFFGFIRQILATIIQEGWDIAGNLAFPCMIITDKSFFKSFKIVRETTKVVPEVIAGAVAFDFVHLSLVGWIVLLSVSPFFGIWLFFKNVEIAGIVGLSIFILLHMLISPLYHFTKSTYFTILYLLLEEGEKYKERGEFKLPDFKKIFDTLKRVKIFMEPEKGT